MHKSTTQEWIEAIFVAALLALFIRGFVVQAFKIPSGSMLETLQIGDHLLVNRFAYDVRAPRFLNRELWESGEHEKIGWFSLFLDTVGGPVIFSTGDPERGDIIVFEYPENPKVDFIKRVIGLPGDTIEIRNKQVYINGEAIDEPYKQHIKSDIQPLPMKRDNFKPITVPPGHYFCMGDNRDDSRDSRFWGFVSREAIVGKALVLYWSWDGPNMTVRWDRLLNMIH